MDQADILIWFTIIKWDYQEKKERTKQTNKEALRYFMTSIHILRWNSAEINFKVESIYCSHEPYFVQSDQN